MMLWVVFLILIAATVTVLLWPMMHRRAPRSAVLAVVILIPVGAMLLYNWLGAPALAN